MDIPSFLRTYPPFDALDADVLDRVVRHTQIEFFPAETVILARSGEPAGFAYVVRTGAVALLDDDRVLDLLGPGELFGYSSLLSGMGPSFTVRTQEDTLCYLIDEQVMEQVLRTRSGLRFLSAGLRRRLARALEGLEADRADPWHVAVGTLVRRPAVTCRAATSVRDAAREMAEQRISSLLVAAEGGWGIVTDRDLRTRVLAEGRAYETPVGEVMSFPVRTVSQSALAAEVLAEMLEGGVHHLPVVDDAGRVLGIVTDTDLMGLARRAPFALQSAVERAPDRDAVVAIGGRLREAVCELVDAGVDPVDVGHVVGVTVDALTRRLIELSADDLGEPPAPWAWLALGSQARHEQGLVTDQDHALAYDPQGVPEAEVDGYFAELATAVTEGLEAAGIPRCRAGVVAANPEWRRPIEAWRAQFLEWMQVVGPEGGELTSIAFDYRRVAGPLAIEQALDERVRGAPQRPGFMRRIARAAVGARPPTGFFRDLVVEAKGEHAGQLDVKLGGITPITSLSRVHALSIGLTERRTLPRLRAAADAGRLDEDDRAGLEEAFRLLWQIRLEHQCAQTRRGEEPDDYVDPRTLGPITRQGLKEAFRVVDRAQRALALAFDLRF